MNAPEAQALAAACAAIGADEGRGTPTIGSPTRGWRGELWLEHERVTGSSTRCVSRHHGPLRVLKTLYPEGPGIAHSVLVHPPGGIVGGDELDIDVLLRAGSHAVISTPGATRFYRSSGADAAQRARLRLEAHARLEWLPLEAIAYPGCRASNEVKLDLAGDAQCLGWDVLALGLPDAGAEFGAGEGHFTQSLAWPGHWIEHGRIAANDQMLLHSALGLNSRPVLATAWFAHGGRGWPEAMRQGLIDSARALIDEGEHARRGDAPHPALACPDAPGASVEAGVTSTDPGLVTLRLLAPRVEPAMALLMHLRAAWRHAAWGLAAAPLRIWRT